MNVNRKEICRLCYYETVDTTDIFGEKGTAFDYIGKISKYLYFSVMQCIFEKEKKKKDFLFSLEICIFFSSSLQVSNDDALPKTVCWMCTQHLETFHRFYEKVYFTFYFFKFNSTLQIFLCR